MQKILILGANGQIAHVATDLFLERTDAHLTLYLRNSSRLKKLQSERITLMEGDVLDFDLLKHAVSGQDIVYANLDGQLVEQARNVVAAMQEMKVSRLIWISSMGIYDEVPGEQFGTMLDPYRKSAALVEASDLDYTILRPHGSITMTRSTTSPPRRISPLKGLKRPLAQECSRFGSAVNPDPGQHYRESLGVNKP